MNSTTLVFSRSSCAGHAAVGTKDIVVSFGLSRSSCGRKHTGHHTATQACHPPRSRILSVPYRHLPHAEACEGRVKGRRAFLDRLYTLKRGERGVEKARDTGAHKGKGRR